MLFLVIGMIIMRYNEKMSFCSDFVIGIIFGLAIGFLILSIILSRKRI